MKKIFVLIFISLSILLDISAADSESTVSKTPESNFDVVFTKVGISEFRFTPAGTYDQEVSSFGFPDYPSATDISIDIGVYWRVYESPITLTIEFIDSSLTDDSGFMLRGVSSENSNTKYNYNVTVTEAVNLITESNSAGTAFSITGVSADDPEASILLFDNVDSTADRTIYIMNNYANTGDNPLPYIEGHADLKLKLNTPTEGFTTGQYEGVLRMVLRTGE